VKLFPALQALFLFTGISAVSCNTPSAEFNHLAAGCEQTGLYLPHLQGKRVGLVANHTTRIGNLHLVDSLLTLGINLTVIFSPEHGFRGDADAGAEIGDAVDHSTGIPVVSLYGNKHKPAAADLKNVDVVVYDIQDVGVRFYTYISTLHYVMEACAENNIPLIVFDRPNPLGHYVDGPVLEPAFRSFVGMHPIPVVYGMTAGELARMVNGENWLNDGVRCELKVIPCMNYSHSAYYALPVDPSPNLNCMEAIYLYPSICFFEGTIMSLGRGTNAPFRVIGHPDYPDRSFSFVPEAISANKNPLFKDQICYGIDLTLLSTDSLQQFRTLQLHWLINVYASMNRGSTFFSDYIDKLAGTAKFRQQILAGYSEQQIREGWKPELEKFKNLRKKYLLYPDFME
jgi:uncharacterized protein YbbC (DUF1343 family)